MNGTMLDERDSSMELVRDRRRSGKAVSRAVLALTLVAMTVGCTGKKRPFGEVVPGDSTEETTDESGDVAEGQGGSNSSPTSTEGELVPSPSAPEDGETNSASLPAAADACGDACSGECEPGATECSSPTERIECGIDALWGDPVACPSVCVDGSCAGECAPGSTECATTTRFRECSELGVWSEVADCEFACVGAACGGACQPGQTRCDSTTAVQVCDDEGQWGPTTACQNACVGNACTGECVPGATRCSSETQLQTCNEQGQFLGGSACPFACVNGSCGGECSPGSRRCSPGSGVPQFCGSNGIWQSQAPCPFVCSGSGSCGGECSPGSRRCSPASGVPQACSQAGSWQNQAACPFVCTNGGCGGECSPGTRRCDPASGVPQVCSDAGIWQSQQGCARGCQNGACIPQIGLGATCGAARDCLSGFCVDGTCCEVACNGPCMACRAGNGRCDVVPNDDDVCAAVECSFDPECATAPSPRLDTNLCAGLGRCKTANDCDVTPFVEGTPCDTAVSARSLCDGLGNCENPIVQCGSASCEIEQDTSAGTETLCCGRRDAASVQSFSCGPRSGCPSNFQSQLPGSNPATCDEPSDCRSGTTCCYASFSNGSDIGCRATCNNRISNPGGGGTNHQLCLSPAFSGTCPAGSTCSVSSLRFPGWAFCSVP